MAKVTPRAREQMWRERVVDMNDGILGVAGLLQGLVAADIYNSTIVITATIAVVAGAFPWVPCGTPKRVSPATQ